MQIAFLEPRPNCKCLADFLNRNLQWESMPLIVGHSRGDVQTIPFKCVIIYFLFMRTDQIGERGHDEDCYAPSRPGDVSGINGD